MKSKLFFSILFILLIHSVCFATRPMRKAFNVKQTDGTVLTITRQGNGEYLFYTTTDNIALMRGSDGALYYAVKNGGILHASDFLAHNTQQRDIQEKTFLQHHKIDITEAYDTMNQMFSKKTSKESRAIGYGEDGLGVYGEPNPDGIVKSIGKAHIPVIMVEFPDRLFLETTTTDKVTRLLNEEGYADEQYCKGSVRDYFLSQSNGLFDPSFEVVAKVKVSNNYSFYGANSTNGSIDLRCKDLVQEAIDSAVCLGVDFSRFDDGNGVPLVSIYFAGPGEHSSYENGCEDYIWAHFSKHRVFQANNVKIRSYFVGNEVLQEYIMDDLGNIIVNSAMIDGFGVFVHELGHALGLPDFYYTGSSNTEALRIQSPDFWSVMDYGQYMYDGYAPIGYSAYERSMMGWLKITELQEAGYYTLYPFHSHSQTDNTAYLLRNDAKPSEYYILENRQPDTWYPSMMGSGMLVFHVDYNYQKWIGNTVNNDSKHQCYALVPADNNKSTEDENGEFSFDAFKGDLFPGLNGNTELSDETNPKTEVFNGEKLNKPLYDIQESEGLVTFCFKDASLVGMNKISNEDVNNSTSDEAVYTIDGKKIYKLNKNYRGILLFRKNGRYIKIIQ